jgi:hypothetical protein
MSDQRQRYHGESTMPARSGQHGSSGTYVAPEHAGPDHGAALEPLSAVRLAMRIALSVVLGLLGLLDVVRVVQIAVGMASAPSGSAASDGVGALVVTVFLVAVVLAYPVINLVRLVRARRAGQR